MVLAGPRVYAKMAEDGVFLELFRASLGLPSDFLSKDASVDCNPLAKAQVLLRSARQTTIIPTPLHKTTTVRKNNKRLGDYSATSPVAAIWLQVALAATVTFFSTLKSLLDYLDLTLSVNAAITVACVLRTKKANDTNTYRVFFTSTATIDVTATLSLAILSAIGNP